MMYVRVRVSNKARVVHWDQRLYMSVQLRSPQFQHASEFKEADSQAPFRPEESTSLGWHLSVGTYSDRL